MPMPSGRCLEAIQIYLVATLVATHQGGECTEKHHQVSKYLFILYPINIVVM